jgi:probable HAF family extracellular repeat protein
VAGASYLAQTVPTTGCPPRHRCVTHPEHAFRYGAGTMTDLGTLGGLYAQGLAINLSGAVAGYSRTSTGNNEAFVAQSANMTGLGSLVPGGSSEAFAINDSGTVGGWSTASDGRQHAFLDIGGKMTDLGLLPGEGGIYTSALGINNSNQVVGGGDNAASYERAFLYSNGKMTDLGTLGGPQAVAYAINNNGQIVGSAQTSTDASHAFLYTNGKMTDLGTFGLDPVPEAINNHGVIVGQSGNGAFIWSAGTFQALNNLITPGSGFVLDDATAINDNGQIVANGHSTTNYQGHAFLLSPG